MPRSDSSNSRMTSETGQASEEIGARVLLVRAHYRKQYRSPGFPVGIALVASYLESKGVFVRIIDLAVNKDWKAALQAEIQTHNYDVVGISFQITQYAEATDVAGYIRQSCPSAKIVFGGSYASSAPKECIKNKDIDAVCCGEGELTMYELIRAWSQGLPLDGVDGLVYRAADGQIAQTRPRNLIDDLDRMPLAAYHLLDLNPYMLAAHTSDFNRRKHRCMELITSRGCPYHCIYCHSFFGKVFRGRSPQHVMDEIRLLHDRYQVKDFVIWDDTFTMDIQRAKDICDLVTSSGLDITIQLRGGVRVEQMDEELMAKLKKAGVETMFVGIETAVWRIQKMIKKNLKIEKVEALLDLAKKYKITTIGLMMLGFPGETVQEMKESFRWASRSKLDYTFYSIVTPFPGTELYDLAIHEGYFATTGNFADMHVMIPHMEIPGVKSSKLKWLQILAYMMFYLRPRRLRKLLSSAYIFTAFASGLFDYMSIAVSYYGKILTNRPRQTNGRIRSSLP